MGRRAWVGIVSLLVLAAATDSVAAPGDYAYSGPYVGLGGMMAIRTDGGGVSSGGGELLAGYRVAPAFGADLDLQVDSDEVLRVVGQAKIYPVSGYRVQPFLLVGLGTYVYWDAAGANGLFRPGAGVDLYLTRRVVLAPVVYYELLFNSRGTGTPSIVDFGVTLQYRF